MIVNTELARSKGHDHKDLWETPDDLFRKLDAEFGFTIDACAEPETTKCPRYFSKEDDGLIQDWSGERVFCNPPYSRGNIDQWARKCYEESLRGAVVVGLLPVSSSATWWHEYVWKKAEIRYLKGRIRFKHAKYSSPFSSCIAIWNNILETEKT